jgi:multiple sugar transport system substrate-binding protein
MRRLKLALAIGAAIGLAATTAHAQTSLTWWHHMPLEGAQGKLFRQYANEFQAANPGVKIEMVSTPANTYFTALSATLAAGDAPDVFAMSYRNFPEFQVNGVLAPIDSQALRGMGVATFDQLRAAWTPTVLDSYRIGDTFYGLPWQFNIYAYIINAKHFREAGLDPVADAPKTWDQVFEVAQKLVKKDQSGRITRQALSFPFTHDAAWYLLEFEPLIRQLGGSILNEARTECLVNSEAGVQAMDTVKKRFKLGVSDKNIAAGLDYYNEGFPTGKFSMTVGGNWGIPRWQKEFTAVVGKDDLLAIPYPTFSGKPTVSSTTSWAWVVSARSSKKDLAWKFAEFLTSQPSRNILETGDIVPRAGWSKTEGARSIPQAAFWEEQLKLSAPLAYFPKYSQVAEVLKKAMEEILLLDRDTKPTLDRAKAEIDALLRAK